MSYYDPWEWCNLKRRCEEFKPKPYQPKEPEYITPVREGNEAFPVFHGITGGYPKELDTLDTNITDDCQSIAEVPKPNLQEYKKPYIPKEPEYITPFREGNEAFPVFHGLTGGYPKELDTLDTNMNDDCQSIEEASKPIQKVKKFKND